MSMKRILRTCAKISRLTEEVNAAIASIAVDNDPFGQLIAESLEEEGLGVMVNAELVARRVLEPYDKTIRNAK